MSKPITVIDNHGKPVVLLQRILAGTFEEAREFQIKYMTRVQNVACLYVSHPSQLMGLRGKTIIACGSYVDREDWPEMELALKTHGVSIQTFHDSKNNKI